MKHLLILPLVLLCGCGTVRYQVKQPTDGRRAQTEIQWDVVELRFNDMWMKVIGVRN
jgi:uncharacterized protein YceK